jgi:predicted DCC family thiol-disulfide oxidoreductase YuxK
MLIRTWFKADEVATDDYGWTANLAIFRLLFLGVTVLPFAYKMLRWTALIMPSLPAEVWVPTAFYRHIPFRVLTDASLAHAMAIADLGLIALAIVGCFTRTALAFATIVSLYLFGLPENLGKISHFQQVIWFMALLAAGPSSAMLSVDAIIAAIRRADRGKVGIEVSRRAALATLRYAWLLIGIAYLGSGVAKLHGTWVNQWVSTKNLKHIIWRNWFERRTYRPGFTLPLRFDRLPPVVIDSWAMGAMALEIGFVAVVLFRWSRWFLILGGLAFHAGNGLVLGIWFHSLLGGYICLLDWSWIGRRLTMKVAGQQSLVVIYDGSCKMCRRTIAILKTFDLFDALAPVSGFSDDPLRLAHPEVTEEMVLRDLYVVGNGYVAGGYDAYQKMATSMILLWPLALIMKLRPIAVVGKRIYRKVADSRYCSIKQAPLFMPVASSHANKSWPALHAVGIFLLVGELTLSAMILGTRELRGDAMSAALRPSVLATAQVISRLHGAMFWPWPFDLYPTFTGAGPNDAFYRRWEVTLVAPDGTEVAVPPEVFAKAFGYWATSSKIMIDVIEQPGTAVKRASVARLLWSTLPETLRTGTVTVRGYDTTYSTDPDDRRLISRTLIDEFPAQQLASGASPARSSWKDESPVRLIEINP